MPEVLCKDQIGMTFLLGYNIGVILGQDNEKEIASYYSGLCRDYIGVVLGAAFFPRVRHMLY